MNTIKTFIFALFLTASVLYAEEFRPVSVWTSAETTPEHGAALMIDGNLATYAELLDDSRTGGDEKTLPPKGHSPVTSVFVLDLGEKKNVRGLRLTAQKSLAPKMAAIVTVFTCDDPQAQTNVKVLADHARLHAVIASHPAFVTWETPVETRFLGVKIEDSYERENVQELFEDVNVGWIKARNGWFQPAYRGLQAGYGFEVSGTGSLFLTDVAEVSAFAELPADFEAPNRPEQALTEARLLRDWLYQDLGTYDVTGIFASGEKNDAEKVLIQKVLKDLGDSSRDLSALENVPGNDLRWKELYVQLCMERRKARLSFLLGKTKQIVYAKHTLLGGGTMHGATENLTDSQYDEWTPDFRPGGQLCVLTLHEDGTVSNEVLYETKEGFLRDPALSFDGKTIAFSMRKTIKNDDFHLYTMDVQTRELKQITFSPEVNGQLFPVADIEPCWLPDGNLIFQSTRCIQTIPCWKNMVSNLYTCAADGQKIRRLGFDQSVTFYPQVQSDGRVTFTRWEYSDKNSSFQQGLFVMNPDGTSQLEFYGNTSYYPVSLLTARGIPGSHKAIAVASGHYVLHKGKLVLIDNRKGMEEDAGIEYVGGSYPTNDVPGRKQSEIVQDPRFASRLQHVFFGQFGPQFQYPFAFDEEHYLVGFLPEGSATAKGPFHPCFGIYYMTADGTRELLAYDPTVSSCQPVPLIPTPLPPQRGSLVDLSQPFGQFYIQNVYVGMGLKDVQPGTVKKLRVVALEYRPCLLGGEGWTNSQSKPPFNRFIDVNGSSAHDIVSLGGTWDVKHVLGEVDVEEDGSCAFEVPANNPVYFQLLDEKGRSVQSMRSWTVLMPGERMACIGCHEDKNQAVFISGGTAARRPRPARSPNGDEPSAGSGNTRAMLKPVQKLQPLPGTEPHPLLARLEKSGLLANSANYLGVNQARDCDAPTVEGFSFTQTVQPILDRHCVRCHDGSDARTSLRLTGEMYENQPNDPHALRDSVNMKRFSQSYVALTHGGEMTPLVNWYSGSGQSEVLPPRAFGSTQSKLMEYLEPAHYEVRLSDAEKRVIACWIDLSIPYAGSYGEHNIFDQPTKDAFRYHSEKRAGLAELEVLGLKEEKR